MRYKLGLEFSYLFLKSQHLEPTHKLPQLCVEYGQNDVNKQILQAQGILTCVPRVEEPKTPPKSKK